MKYFRPDLSAEAFLASDAARYLNGTDIFARVDEQEKVVRALAAGMMDPKHFLAWLRQNSTSATAK